MLIRLGCGGRELTEAAVRETLALDSTGWYGMNKRYFGMGFVACAQYNTGYTVLPKR